MRVLDMVPQTQYLLPTCLLIEQMDGKKSACECPRGAGSWEGGRLLKKENHELRSQTDANACHSFSFNIPEAPLLHLQSGMVIKIRIIASWSYCKISRMYVETLCKL